MVIFHTLLGSFFCTFTPMIKKLKHQFLQTMVGCVGGKEVHNHGQIAINGEEDESGQNIGDDDDVEEVEYIDLSPHEVVNVSCGKSLTPSIGGGRLTKEVVIER